MKYKSLETLIRGVLTEGASADMDRNTEKRRTVVNVGRLDPTPSRFKPTSEKSKLAKTGEIMTKVIDEADDIDWGKLSDPIHNVEIKDKKTGTSIWNTSHRARDKQHALEIAKAKVAREGKKPEDYTFTHVNEEVGLEEDALSNLAKLNTHIKDINVIKPGDKINLPGGKSYTVASGDTMSAIASGRYKGTAPTSGPELGKGPDSRMAAPSGQPTTVPSEPTKTSEPSTASTPAKEPPKDPDLSGNDRLKSAYDFASKFDGSEIGSPLTGTPAGTRTGSLAGDMSKIGIKNGKLKSDDDDKDTTNEDYDIVKDKSDRSSTQKTDSPRIVSGGKTPINLNPRLDTSPGDPDKPVKAKKMFKDQSGQPVKEDQDPSHYNAVGSGLRDKMRAFVRRNRDQTEKSKTQQQINLLKPKNEETTMTDNLLSEKELAAIAEIASQFDEARKKGTKEDANKPSIGDQRGEKGDQSGDNPTNNTARYDISDEVVTEKLVGKQKKIDKNHNGKIDAQDFELLRKEEEQVDEYTSQISKKFTPNHTMKPGSSKGNYTQPGSDQGRHQGSVHTNTSTGSKNKPAISTPAPAPKKPSPADLKGKQDRLIYTKPDKLSPSEIRSKSRMEEVEQVTTLTADQLKQFNAVLEAEAAKRGRGRPKKNVEGDEPRPEGRDPREHIQVQAGRAMAGVPVNFKHDDGSMTKLTAPMGRQITTQLNALKPAARQDAVSKIHGSASGLRDVMGIK